MLPSYDDSEKGRNVEGSIRSLRSRYRSDIAKPGIDTHSKEIFEFFEPTVVTLQRILNEFLLKFTPAIFN